MPIDSTIRSSKSTCANCNRSANKRPIVVSTSTHKTDQNDSFFIQHHLQLIGGDPQRSGGRGPLLLPPVLIPHLLASIKRYLQHHTNSMIAATGHVATMKGCRTINNQSIFRCRDICSQFQLILLRSHRFGSSL